MLTIMAVFFVSVLVLVGILLFMSPGTPKPFIGDGGKPLAGSISEKIRVNIGGVEQGMFIKGRNTRNPVLLYLHGGMPDYFLTEHYPTGLDDDFTVVWWEQRGSGLSYRADVPPESVNPEQLVSDTVDVTNYLRKRFGREKIYLMGHSGGTFIGIQAAARAPELYHAYLGVAQMSNQLESERLAYDYTVSYPLAKSYYERLDAPVKGFYTFKQSAHSPFFEEPGKMRDIVRADVLTGSKRLADPE